MHLECHRISTISQWNKYIYRGKRTLSTLLMMIPIRWVIMSIHEIFNNTFIWWTEDDWKKLSMISLKKGKWRNKEVSVSVLWKRLSRYKHCRRQECMDIFELTCLIDCDRPFKSSWSIWMIVGLLNILLISQEIEIMRMSFNEIFCDRFTTGPKIFRDSDYNDVMISGFKISFPRKPTIDAWNGGVSDSYWMNNLILLMNDIMPDCCIDDNHTDCGGVTERTQELLSNNYRCIHWFTSPTIVIRESGSRSIDLRTFCTYYTSFVCLNAYIVYAGVYAGVYEHARLFFKPATSALLMAMAL